MEPPLDDTQEFEEIQNSDKQICLFLNYEKVQLILLKLFKIIE